LFKSRLLRAVVIALLLGGVWLILAGWSTDSPQDRFVEVCISAVVLLFALFLALPSRAGWALRIVAGAIGLIYVWYFGTELWGLVGGHAKPIRLGQPSATMAGLGLLIIGIPMLVFALSGTSLLRHLIADRRTRQQIGLIPEVLLSN
jgi:hypothetical protein